MQSKKLVRGIRCEIETPLNKFPIESFLSNEHTKGTGAYCADFRPNSPF